MRGQALDVGAAVPHCIRERAGAIEPEKWLAVATAIDGENAVRAPRSVGEQYLDGGGALGHVTRKHQHEVVGCVYCEGPKSGSDGSGGSAEGWVFPRRQHPGWHN